MRRTILLLAGVLLSAVALGSDSPKEYDDRTEVAGIEGTKLPLMPSRLDSVKRTQ